MKRICLGGLLVLLIGIGGFVYRNIVEYQARTIACPVPTFTCPDGTVLQPIALSCSFPLCPPPNETHATWGITYVVPADYTRVAGQGESVVYERGSLGEGLSSRIELRRYLLTGSTTPLALIQETAIDGTAGMPISPSRFTSLTLGSRTVTVVPIDRFEGNVQMAYYLTRAEDVVRIDATDRSVPQWMEPGLDVMALPGQQAVHALISTLQSR